MSEQKYRELYSGEIIQPGDEFCVSIGQDRWHPYPTRRDGSLVSASSLARRPIAKAAKQPQSQPIEYEEVPGSRTTQDAVSHPQRERIAYEELQPGTEVQAGDQYRNTQGRWVEYNMDTSGVPIVGATAMARRPHKITALQDERDELKAALRESHAAHAFTTKQGLAACKERDEACRERDLARSEVAKLSTELWARRPLEERVASLTDELANAREDFRKLVKTNVKNTDQFAEHTATLVRERDEARAERGKLKGLIDDLLDEPTARQVQDMLRTWATELDWSAGCFGSFGRSQIDIIQQTMVAVIQRIEGMIHPEGGTDGN